MAQLWLNPKCSSHWYNKEKNRRSGQPNFTFLSRRSSKRKTETPIESFRLLIVNARAITVDSVILFFFHGIHLNGKKLPLSVVVVLLQLLLNMHTTNAIRKRLFAH